jgi:hypothetical protein
MNPTILWHVNGTWTEKLMLGSAIAERLLRRATRNGDESALADPQLER